jgi:hypothetical protein
VKINGLTLHSDYAPENEARRYLNTLDLPKKKAVYLLIEPGKGYLTEELIKRSPDSSFLELHCSDIFAETPQRSTVAKWNPTSGISLSDFLHEHVPDLSLGQVFIVEWPPASRVFGETYKKLRERVLLYLRERRASLHTTGIFGKKWLGNSVKRLLRTEKYLLFEGESRPVILCAGGPSLERSLSALKQLESTVAVWALPSALKALRFRGIIPDFVVHSDAGFYASYHLWGLSGGQIVQMAPLFSALPSESSEKLLLLTTRTLIEDFLIQKARLPSTAAASHGTVAGTALSAALSLSRGPIIFAGLDLSFSDVRSHVRPHTFDRLFLSQCDRKKTLLDIYYRRSPRSSTEQDYALRRYREWFSSLRTGEADRIYRMFPSAAVIPAFHGVHSTVDLSALVKEHGGSPGRIIVKTIGRKHRAEAVFSYLQKIREETSLLENIKNGNCFMEEIIRYPLLKEFISFCCYAELIGLAQKVGENDQEHLQKLRANIFYETENLMKIAEG